MTDKEFGTLKLLKLKYKRGTKKIERFSRIGSPLINLRKLSNSENYTPESYTMLWYRMNYKQFGSLKLLKLKYRSEDHIIQPFCRIGSAQKTRSSLFNLRKFSKSEKTAPEPCRMLWNLMNDQEFGTLKLLKLK